ncbi:MAG: hypothetical protein AAGB19_23070, partial [Cyanobacteria bacterium P01_F01_bin.3]
LTLLLGIVIGTVFGAGGLFAFSMAAIAADSDRMIAATQPSLEQLSLVDTDEPDENTIPFQARENRL